jgi:NAD(P)-dependent dehydrogenase (short-subunit alcohol dehydrogenase family)
MFSNAQGATVIICSRSELESLPEVNGNRAHFFAADVRDIEQINSVIDYAKNTFGRLDVSGKQRWWRTTHRRCHSQSALF